MVSTARMPVNLVNYVGSLTSAYNDGTLRKLQCQFKGTNVNVSYFDNITKVYVYGITHK